MADFETTRFDIRSGEFNKTVSEFTPGDENAWSLLDSRQFEIMDSVVDNSRKAKAMDRVLLEMSRIFPRSDTAYCQALQKRLALTDKKNTADMERIAKEAYFHRRNVDIMLYGKIIYDVYKASTDKNNFPYKDIVKSYRKRQLAEENALGREQRQEDLNRIDFDLEQPETNPVQKLHKIEEALELLQDKYFGPVEANSTKKRYCHAAADICRRELFDTDTAAEYLGRAKEYERRAEKARIQWAKRRGMPTNKQEEAYKQKFRTDTGNEY